jgi:branched-chain amino acid transport system permease protein
VTPRPAPWIAAAVVVALACVPLAGAEFYTELASKTLLLAIFAMSLDLLVGSTGLVSFGHAAYFGVASYAAALLAPKYEASSLWLTMPAAVGLSALAALAVGFFALRTRGTYFIMVTLAFAQLFYFLFHDTALGGGSDGIYLNVKPSAALFGVTPFALDDARQLYWFILAVAVLVYLFLARVLQSPFGRTLAGVRTNEHRMQSLGYKTFRYKLAAFTLAGALAGVAGYLYAVVFGFVTPELLSWHQSGNVLLMVILGGMGNLAGAVAGAFAFVAMQEVFASWTKHWQLLLGGVIVVAVLFLPGGLSAVPARIRRSLGREDGDD